jgi:tetratricopeptide (TPR) repeat protein
MSPRLARIYIYRGATYSKLQRFKEAIDDYTVAVELDPENALAFRNRGVSYIELSHYEEAFRDLTQARARTYNNRALVFLERSMYDEAIRDSTMAIELDPEFVNAYLNRARAHYLLGRYEEALTDYNQAIGVNSGVAEIYKGRMVVYSKLERYGEELSDLIRTIELDPEYALEPNSLRSVDTEFRRLREKIKAFEIVVNEQPENTQAKVNSERAYLNLVRFEELVHQYTRALDKALLSFKQASDGVEPSTGAISEQTLVSVRATSEASTISKIQLKKEEPKINQLQAFTKPIIPLATQKANLAQQPTSTSPKTPLLHFTEDPMAVLKLRYAKGELTREQYESIAASPASEDPVALLKLRYAKGEITKEHYDEALKRIRDS